MSSHSSTTAEFRSSTNPPAAGPARIVQPYLFFGGRCEEAIQYYARVLGAEVTMLMHFKDSPDQGNAPAPVDGDKVMHASLRIGATELMASDGCDDASSFQGFALSLTLPTMGEAERVFAALAEGGKVQQPLIATFFAQGFGMVADRFGVSWMVMVPLPASGAKSA
jgi:PhnB protein